MPWQCSLLGLIQMSAPAGLSFIQARIPTESMAVWAQSWAGPSQLLVLVLSQGCLEVMLPVDQHALILYRFRKKLQKPQGELRALTLPLLCRSCSGMRSPSQSYKTS